ncbi:dehydrogenase/reductase SDR family member 7-like [Erethizon dorsatum]
MACALLLLLPALCALLLLGLGLFLRADGDLTLQWAEWRGRRPEQELTGMVVWVTGASSGIGEELAYQLSKLGVSLVLSARREHELERVKRRCLENGSVKEKDVLILPLDLTDRSSHEVATKAVLQEFGRIDILINNGGRAQNSWTVDTNMDVFKELMELNYLGTVSLTKCVLPHMIERKQGKIVTVISLAGIVSGALYSGYSASKHALRGFFNSLHIELGEYPDIIISNIYPGPVHSNVLKNALTEEITKTFGHDVVLHQMATSRCVRLILIAMANNLKEVWMSGWSFLFLAYLWQYMPSLACWMSRMLQKKQQKQLQKVRFIRILNVRPRPDREDKIPQAEALTAAAETRRSQGPELAKGDEHATALGSRITKTPDSPRPRPKSSHPSLSYPPHPKAPAKPPRSAPPVPQGQWSYRPWAAYTQAE